MLYVNDALVQQIIGAAPCILFDGLNAQQAHGLNIALYPFRLAGAKLQVITSGTVRAAKINWQQPPTVCGIRYDRYTVVPDPGAKPGTCPCCGIPLKMGQMAGPIAQPGPSAIPAAAPRPNTGRRSPIGQQPAVSGKGGIVVEDVDMEELLGETTGRSSDSGLPAAGPQSAPSAGKAPATSQPSNQASESSFDGVEAPVARASETTIMEIEDFERALAEAAASGNDAAGDALARLEDGLPTLRVREDSPQNVPVVTAGPADSTSCSVVVAGGRGGHLAEALAEVMNIDLNQARKLATRPMVTVAKHISRAEAEQLRAKLERKRVKARIQSRH
jgi:hypothetical protein